ncbi:cell division protein FtsQ/DivIB [Pontibacillus litoralis]|uniref:Cell division protein DivIB n=1 Tax=Pontibacillus litoralis JSM 072002 TaxID=1385512 RepID=A0A0A5HY64_9BACI|nr:FtsQ-type POTRA domain-containing protein [Pontibacillus litoralis]KGX88537.1 hypothetical protein N784_07660 [Pontibacillus litoralis JSM 072002]
MSEKKKIVSIEDRIPKLKEARRKKANRRLIMYLSFFFLLILLIIYLQSPLSNVQEVKVSGTLHLKEEAVIKESGITTSDNFWKVNRQEVASTLKEHTEIKSVRVDKQFPATIMLHIEEEDRVGYVQKNGGFYPILSTGEQLTSYKTETPSGDAPILIGWKKQKYVEQMTKELQQLPESIAQLISEIHWKPTDQNPYKIHLYMNDGYEVIATIRNFSEKMQAYPSIVSQLDSSQKGVIHIDVGAYFEEYPSKKNEKEGNSEDE